MKLTLLASSLLAVALLAAPPARAEDSLADQVKAIQKEYQTATTEYSTAYRAATTPEAKAAVAKEKLPDRAKFAARYMEVAKKAPADAAAADALVAVVSMDYRGKLGAEALDLLSQHHLTSPKLKPTLTYLPYASGPGAEKFARALAEKSPDRDIQGQATMALAAILKDSNPAEAAKVLQQVVDKFGDIKSARGTLGEAAQKEITHAQKFGIGKVAPDIAGEDIDGKAFKLSDYRGKVVMIDFWGDW